MLKWLESRLLWGGLLIFAGAIFLLQNMGYITIGDLLWAFLLGLGGVFFFMVFFQDRENWWALIPGFTLLSIAVLITLNRFVPQMDDELGGPIVLGGIGLSFLVIFLMKRHFWWAIIPAGVLITLAVVAGLESLTTGLGLGGIFFLGLGLTFALVALIPTADGPMRWAWIPAGILFLMGLLVLAAAEEMIGLLWPAFLILAGGYLIFRTFRSRS